jgi:steroid 5-alpha reductase family enzyme
MSIDIGLAFAGALGYALAVVFIYMTAGFIVSLYLRRADIADSMWGIGFVLVAVLTWWHFNTLPSLRQLVIIALVSIWGLRLARHIYARNHGRPEDFRYQAWRTAWGSWFPLRSYLQIFLLQGVLLVLIAAPIIFVNRFDDSVFTLLGWGLFETAGLIVWLIGFYFESRGDAELKSFIANPENKGKILTTGLWAYTRHPNYFGEVAQWWGIWLIALGLPFGVLAIIGPLTISTLILKVSGVPMLEKKYEGNPAFEEYKKHTSAFFPLPPR